MRLFRTSFHIDHQPGKSLRLRLRPSFVICCGSLLSVLPLLLSLITLPWQAVLSTWVLFIFPAFFTSVLIWHSWADAVFPPIGNSITWRDGLLRGHIPASRVLAAQVDHNVQPKLHKGPGPTAFIRIWVADQHLLQLSSTTDPWIRVFTSDLSPATIITPSSAASDPAKLISAALRDLGYPPNLPIKT